MQGVGGSQEGRTAQEVGAGWEAAAGGGSCWGAVRAGRAQGCAVRVRHSPHHSCGTARQRRQQARAPKAAPRAAETVEGRRLGLTWWPTRLLRSLQLVRLHTFTALSQPADTMMGFCTQTM